MQIFLVCRETQERRTCVEPYANADHVLCEGPCPCCGCAGPFKLAGRPGSMHATPDDRAFEACGACVTCGATVGTLRVEPSTLFGVTEDAAVLGSGRYRVY